MLHNVATPGPGGECVSDALTGDAIRAALVATAEKVCETTHTTASWTLEKSSDPVSGSTVDPGDQVTYTLTVTNTGSSPLTKAVVTDDLSDVLQYASLVSLPNAVSMSGDTLTWKVPTIDTPGDTAELSYTVTVNDDTWDVSFANIATPGKGGACTSCSTTHQTPDEPSNPNEPGLPNTGGTSMVPLALGGGFLIVGALMLAESRRRRPAQVTVKSDPKR
jgi:uncharacterized repeat protein (TIGR01451 family)/LPXTG-motif cell wall-anchored protein